MSSRNFKQRKTRRSSSILKKAISDENDPTADLTNATRAKNPLQKRLSKRVSFADADQINVIDRVKDIRQNWQDSLSDSSEAGISALSDVSNLTTPNIKKAQVQQSSGNVPKALQNLLKAAIIDDGENMLDKTQGSCAMDISGVSTTPKFSFFDNSKLGLGDECDTDASDNPEDKEKNAMVASFYTKDFLRSLQLDKSDKDQGINFAQEKQYPHVNPPSYNQCVKGAGRKSEVPVMKVQTSDAMGDYTIDLEPEDMDGVQKAKTVVEIHAGNLSPLVENGDMELTCATIQGVQKVSTDPKMQSQNISSITDSGDMELTCATFTNAQKAKEQEIQVENISPSTDSGDMDFRCAIQCGLKTPIPIPNSSAETSSPCNDVDDMEFTCVLQPQNALLSAKTGFRAEMGESVSLEEKGDEMDFTCAVPRLKILTEETSEHNRESGLMDITECIKTNVNNADNTNNERSPQELYELDDGMDFTCAVTKTDVNSSGSTATSQIKELGQQNSIMSGGDLEEAAVREVTEDQTGANEIHQAGDKTIIFDHSTAGDMDLTLGDLRPGLADGACAPQIRSDRTANSDAANFLSPCKTTGDIQQQTVSHEEHCGLEFQKSVESPNVHGVTSHLCNKLTQQHEEPRCADVCTIAPDQSHSEITLAPALPFGSLNDKLAYQDSEQVPEHFAAQSNGSQAAVKPSADNCQATLNTSDDMEELDFASPLKKRLHKIRNSIGLYKAMQNSRPEKRSDCMEDVNTFPDNSPVNAKRFKSFKENITEEIQGEIPRPNMSKVPEPVITPADCVFVPDSQSEPLSRAWNPELSQIPESQNTATISESDSAEETASAKNGKESERREIGCCKSASTLLTQECDTSDHAGEAVASQSDERSDGNRLSVSLHKSLIDDICQELSMTKEANITVQEFLSVYAEINMGNLKKSRHSIVVPSVKLHPLTTLHEIFEAKYWTPREVAIREACVELMRKKIEWLEKSISDLEGQFHSSNPAVFQTIRKDPDGNAELLDKLQKLATNCKSLGNVYWKRDATKLHKGLNKELNTFINENLLPVSQELEPCKELFEKALEEMEKEGGEGPDETALHKPTVEQNAIYVDSKAELDRLKTRHQELMEKIESVEERKEKIRKRRTELTNRLIESDFTFEESKSVVQQESLSELQKSSLYILRRVDDRSLEFSFLSESVVFTASFEESSSWEWTRKITSFSLETIGVAELAILPFDAGFYTLVHKLLKSSLQLTDLVTEYSNLAGLKNMLGVLSNLVRACHDLLEDKNWINCQLVCECSVSAEEASITVSFLSPQSGVDGFAVKFLFESSQEVDGSRLDRMLRGGFAPISHECIMGRRCLDYLGKEDVERIVNNLEPGPHYLKRAVGALLQTIEYKHWA